MPYILQALFQTFNLSPKLVCYIVKQIRMKDFRNAQTPAYLLVN